MLKDCLCRDVKLTKNADPYKCSYFGYGVGFDSFAFSISNCDFGKNFIIYDVGKS